MIYVNIFMFAYSVCMIPSSIGPLAFIVAALNGIAIVFRMRDN